MARYDLDYERGSYGGFGERGRFGTMSRRRRFAPVHTRGRYMRGYGGEYRGRERLGYGAEYMGRRRMGYSTMGEPRGGREYMGYGLGYGTYGEEYGAMGYGREYEKSRWETDYGDPFHDRERGTPIRMTRGEFGEYGAEFRGRGAGMAGRGYETEFRPRRYRRYRY